MFGKMGVVLVVIALVLMGQAVPAAAAGPEASGMASMEVTVEAGLSGSLDLIPLGGTVSDGGGECGGNGTCPT